MKTAIAKASSVPSLSPAQIARLRGKIAQIVQTALPHAQEVIAGTRSWTPTQVRLFGILVGKVVPDISASYVEVNDVSRKRVNGLSRDELEQLVRGEIIDVSPVEGEQTPGFEPDSADLSPGDTLRAHVERAHNARDARPPGGTPPKPPLESQAIVTSPGPAAARTTNENVSDE